MYNDFWMAEQGFVQRQPQGDLSDLITHRAEAGEVISVTPNDTLLTAYRRMRGSRRLAVARDRRDGRAIGLLDESDLLVKVHGDAGHFNDTVRSAMTDKLETLAPSAKIQDLLGVFDRGRVAIIMDGDKIPRSHHAHRSARLFAPANGQLVVESGPRIFLN